MRRKFLHKLFLSFGLLFLSLGFSVSYAENQEEVFIPNEALLIKVPLDTNAFINGGYAIDGQGMVELPVLGKIIVGDKTRKELEAYLSSKLSDYLKDTHVQVYPALRITLVGYWKKPGMFYINADAVLWDAVLISGGPQGEKNIEKMLVMRGPNDMHIPTLEAYSKGISLKNAGIKSGDIFVIPVPDEKNSWYWFKESLTVTAQIVGIVASAATIYYIFENPR